MTGKEKLVAESVKILMTCGLLGLTEAKEQGFIVTQPDGQWDFQPGLKSAGSFLDKAMKGLTALGLARRAKLMGPTLAEQLAALPPDEPIYTAQEGTQEALGITDESDHTQRSTDGTDL